MFGPPREPGAGAGLRLQAYPWHAYALGYRAAAESLLEGLTDSIGGGEFLSYPAVFCCRHYLELRIKDIISCAHEAFSLSGPVFSTHDLPQLWHTARELARAGRQQSPDPDDARPCKGHKA